MKHQNIGLWLSAAAVAAVGLTACGSDSDSDAADGGETKLRVNVFGNFGYEDLYKQFEADHPGVTIVESAEGDLGQYNTQLAQKIAAGSGAGDVVAIEEGQVVNFLQTPENFVNMQDHGSNDNKDQWLPWKYDQATTADGAYTIGLGTDVGGMAMCYRRDLFEQAGLPTDREEVSALWPTWDDFIATGEQFQEGIGDDKVHFVDSATNTYNSILMQSGRRDLLRPRQQPDHRVQPGCQGCVGPVARDGRRRLVGQAEVVLQRVERRLQERQLRHRGLPGVDDGLHRGAVRPGQRRQVGHRQCAWRWRQLGWIVPRGALEEREPRPGDRARRSS